MEFAVNAIDGARLACRVSGSGPAVVLVHGTALSQVIWRGFGYLRALEPQHTVVTLDLRGHGRSDKPAGEAAYRMDLMVADVLAVLARFDVEQAHYVGYSLGGRVGFSLADAYPERLLSLVSAAGATGNQPGAFDRIFFPGCIPTLETAGMEGFLAAWEGWSGASLDRATRTAFAANDSAALAAYMRAADRDTGLPEGRLAEFNTRTLLLVGSLDDERLGAARAMSAIAPNAELRVIEGAGHADVLRHPETLPAIQRFIG